MFLMPAARSDVALVTTARVFIREGGARQDQFARHRLPATAFSDLQALVDTFEAVSRGRRAARSSQTEAQAEIESALARGLDAKRTLDVVMANVLASDPGLLAAWKRDRRVEGTRRSASPGSASAAEAAPVVPVIEANESLLKAS
jgi:hypothetical protein